MLRLLCLLPLVSCTAAAGAYKGFLQGWAADPPPLGIPGVPFYLDPSFWVWTLSGSATLAASVKGTHVVVKARARRRELANSPARHVVPGVVSSNK